MNVFTRRRFLLSATPLAAAVLFSPAFAQIVVPKTPPAAQHPDALITLIKSVQKKYVRESFGTSADQCFTDDNLVTFHEKKTVQKIVKDLSSSTRMNAIVSELQSIPVVQREEILDEASSTFKPTWAQLGKIDRAGQTEAGQTAEREIAEAITGIARQSLK